MAKRLYLFVGFPGSGKTTIAKLIEERTGAVHLWADRIRKDMFGSPTHSPSESSKLYAALNSQTDKILAAGKSVIFDTNFNFKHDREYLKSIAERNDAEMLIIWITTPKDLARERATHDTHRVKNGYDDPMTVADFERLTNHLQTPDESERFVQIDGTDIHPDDVAAQLGI